MLTGLKGAFLFGRTTLIYVVRQIVSYDPKFVFRGNSP
jgi:hypothetical protein